MVGTTEFQFGEDGVIKSFRDGKRPVRLGNLKLSEERLAGFPFPPVVAVEHRRGIVGEIVVRLALSDHAPAPHRARRGCVCDEPSCVAQQSWQVAIGRGQRLRILDIMGVKAGGRLIAAQDEGRAGGTAHRRAGVSASIATTSSREAIEMRRFDTCRTVCGDVRRHVVGNDPDEIRLGGGTARHDREKRQEKKA
jgi:hypothetical protein